MEIAILVFFLAIFGGVLFLLALIWFVFRRIRKSRSASRNFTSDSNHGTNYYPPNENIAYLNVNDSSGEVYADNSSVESQSYESPVSTETAYDVPQKSEHVHSHAGHSEYSAPPAETIYTESSSSGSDSGASYDSGSSSSDSGSSSSSSD